MKIKSFLTKPFVLLLLSACLSALPLTFSSLFLLSWISFVPLFYVIINSSDDKLRYVFGRGFLFGFLYHFCIYYWFLWFYPLDYVNLTKAASLAVVALAWLGISVVHGALWCIPFICCFLVKKITDNKCFLSMVATIGIIATQKITELGELSFPWVRVSLGQYKATALIQSAAILGADGVDIIILAVNALFAVAIISQNHKRIAAFCVATVIFVANLGFGMIRLNIAKTGDALTIMTVQASVDQHNKWSNNGDKICYDAYSTLTKENITDNVDLVLWPESAVPKIYKNAGALKQYKNLSKEIDTPILAGIILRTASGNTNNAILIDQDKPITSYTKRQMVPFGEYMPYKNLISRLFPVLTELNIIEDDYVSGSDSVIMSVKNGKLGNIICFESIYPELTRKSVLDGAELMVEVTNDSWLETSPAMYQHLAHGVFRSVESGRYLIRSANTGISTIIDNRGNIKSTLGIEEEGVLQDTVYFYSDKTIYTKVGNLAFPVIFTTVVIWALILLIKKGKASN